MLRISIVFVCLLWGITGQAAAKPYSELFGDKTYNNTELQKFLEALDYKQGTVQISSINVTFTVPDRFYFLNAADTKRVLVELWGNPESATNGILGMIFPARSTPYDETWGAVVSFVDDGYVSDENADEIDYEELLQSMKASTRESNKARQKQGFDPITLVGWASPPFYERETHKLHWAKELQFGTSASHTLNYDVRALGRHGVLSINFVAEMNQLATIKSVIPDVMAMPKFDEGASYADYIPGTDKLAAYGIGGLIAGKVLSKLGILAIVLVFLKKAWFVVVLALGAIGSGIRRFMRRS